MEQLVLTSGNLYTLVKTNGMTNKIVTTAVVALNQTNKAGDNAYGFTPKGKRKLTTFWFDRKGHLVFAGNEAPIMVDSETDGFMVDACINFVTDKPKELAEWIVKNNLNPEFNEWSRINYRGSEAEAHDLQPLFTEYPLEQFK